MEIVIGKGVKLEQAEDALAKSAGELIDGEVVWYFAKCNNLKPMTNAIVITNARVFRAPDMEPEFLCGQGRVLTS